MSDKIPPMSEAVALAKLETSLVGLERERETVLSVISSAAGAKEFATVNLYAPQLADIRRLHTNVTMAIVAYHSGVKSAAVLGCLMEAYLTLPEQDRAASRA
ncbi:MAG: hypothetical protein LBF24_01995 [Puniceicoccales bacterium]|jgi:hypothetical protein|nr:hypothetical protein [Puniceicoccales bacterium]